jgi:glutamyl-tRNA synthetase
LPNNFTYMSRRVRVRFAPSPTGPLHIGGVRTALFNYLFALKHKGDFILRIEDTDQARFVPGAEEYIMESLKWCGLQYSEGPDKGGPHSPYRQSQRKELYRNYAEILISGGNAYYAFDESQVLDSMRKQYEAEGKNFQYDSSTRLKMRNSLTLSKTETTELLETGVPHVIRFKMPENHEVSVTDLIRGEVKVHSSLLDDKVLFKTDGLPTYHLANIVDDYLMEITHVIRGEEWLPSLPLHVLLYRALGWENVMPEFAHLPLILKPNGQGKLSKRDGDKLGFPVFPLQWTDPFTGEVSSGYRESGYFPDAMINILAFLGWNPGTEQEIFSLCEMADAFTLERVGKSGSHFDPEKAKWYNQQYLKSKPDNDLAALFVPVLQSKGYPVQLDYLKKVASLVKERLTFISEFWDQAFYFFEAPSAYDMQMAKKIWKEDTYRIVLEVKTLMLAISDFSSKQLEAVVNRYVAEKGIGFGKVATPLRLIVVGSGIGPHLFDIMDMIGKNETINRIDKGLQSIPDTLQAS